MIPNDPTGGAGWLPVLFVVAAAVVVAVRRSRRTASTRPSRSPRRPRRAALLVVTALVGVPFFFALILGTRSRSW